VAYHYTEPGYSPIEVGYLYASSLGLYATKAKLKRVNHTTGTCVLAYEFGDILYLSTAKLSNWHRIGKPNE
jgi:hypothetical protein